MVTINAPPCTVWRTLTDPVLMTQWMAETEVGVEIITGWQVGSPIVIRGFHHTRFENTGTVLSFEPNSILRYTQLSSLSRLPDRPENYSIYTFRLIALGENATSLEVEIENFPTEAIFRHVEFYWRVTIHLIQEVAQQYQEQSEA